MRKVLRIVAWSVLGLAIAAVAAFLGMRAYRQHANAEAIAIHAPNGIEESMYVKAGGIEQWIQIRGQDRSNPVLLCLHGGPGASWRHLTPVFLEWEKQFTVVQWDQRGTGKTLESTGASVAGTMSVDRMAADGIEVAEFLRGHLHQPKIFLFAHSWGSLLGVRMARQRPDLFYAYVGTGQLADMNESQKRGYQYLLDQAGAAKDQEMLAELRRIGPPPFDDMDKIVAFFMALPKYEPVSDKRAMRAGFSPLYAPDFSLWDVANLVRGFASVPTFAVYHEMLSADLRAHETDFAIPVLILQGRDDQRTQLPVVREYFDAIQAPRKELVELDGGHFAAWAEPDRVLRELATKVLPLAK